MQFHRYALYFTPPAGPFSDFACSWLGWDMQSGQPVAHPDIPCLPAPVGEITQIPRKYGLHATIKPPFRLAEGRTADDLKAAMSAYCQTRCAIVLDGLNLAQLGRFLALVPNGNTSSLNTFSADVVREFDTFRAPSTAAELDRRRSNGMSDALDANLRNWGYPYVMDAYRFHITLSGKLPKAQAATLRATLAPMIEPLLPRPYVIDGLSLAGEDTAGQFHLIERHLFKET